MTSVRPAVRPWVVLLGLLALAANLRAALAGYPPLLETVRAELGTSAGVAGLVQAGAVLMMAAGSFAGPAVGARFGREPALGGAVGLVALGGLLRGIPALLPLIGG
ncbi:MAG: MFS transporter, partial [Pseudonocardiales bacterium]|nr:MFS transporter [Pseudonocardiales bacterium]